MRLTRAVCLSAMLLSSGLFAAPADAPPPTAPKPPEGRADLYGDPLPTHAIARLGSIRYRPGEGLAGVGYLPEGGVLAIPTSRHGLEHWDVRTGKRIQALALGTRSIRGSAMSADGTRAAIVSVDFDASLQAPLHQLQMFDSSSGERVLGIVGDEPFGTLVAISPDKRAIATVNERGSVRIWDVAAQTASTQLAPLADRVVCLAFSNDSQTLVIGAGDQVLFWEWSGSGQPRRLTMTEKGQNPRQVLACDFSPDGRLLAIGLDGARGVAFVDPSKGELVRWLSLPEAGASYCRAVAFSPSGDRLAVANNRGGEDGVVVFDVAQGTILSSLQATLDAMTDLAFSPDGSTLAAVSSSENLLNVWELPNGPKLSAERPGHEAAANFTAFVPGSLKLVSAGEDGTIRLWDVSSSQQIKVMSHLEPLLPASQQAASSPQPGQQPARRHVTSWIRGCDVSPDGKWIASSSLDDTVRVWEVATGKEKYRLPGHGRSGGNRALKFTPDSNQLLSWGDDMYVYGWAVATGKAFQDVRLRPTGFPSPEEESFDEQGPYGASMGLGKSAFFPDGSALLLNLQGFRLFDCKQPNEARRLPSDAARAGELAISPDGKQLLASYWGRSIQVRLPSGRIGYAIAKSHLVKLLRLSDGFEVASLELPGYAAGPVSFSPEGRFFCVAGQGVEPWIRVFSLADVREVAHLQGFDSEPRTTAFSQDGRLLASALRDTTILVWDLTSVARGARTTEQEKSSSKSTAAP